MVADGQRGDFETHTLVEKNGDMTTMFIGPDLVYWAEYTDVLKLGYKFHGRVGRECMH